MEQHLCVFFDCPRYPNSLRGTEKLWQYSLFNGHAFHRITRALTKILCSTIHSLVGHWAEDKNGNICWSKRLETDHSEKLSTWLDYLPFFFSHHFSSSKPHSCIGWSSPCHAPYSPCQWETLFSSSSQQAERENRGETKVNSYNTSYY